MQATFPREKSKPSSGDFPSSRSLSASLSDAVEVPVTQAILSFPKRVNAASSSGASCASACRRRTMLLLSVFILSARRRVK